MRCFCRSASTIPDHQERDRWCDRGRHQGQCVHSRLLCRRLQTGIRGRGGGQPLRLLRRRHRCAVSDHRGAASRRRRASPAAHSWISTSATIAQAGGRVVFCDADPPTFTIDPGQIEASDTTPRTVGIVPVASVRPAGRHGRDHGDRAAATALGDRGLRAGASGALQGQRVGTFGQAATYSFYPGKNLGASATPARRHDDGRLTGWPLHAMEASASPKASTVGSTDCRRRSCRRNCPISPPGPGPVRASRRL